MEGLIFEILRYIEIQGKKRKVVVFCSPSPQNVKLDNLTSWSCSDCKEIFKKARRTKLLFWFVVLVCFGSLRLLLFGRSPCRRRRRYFTSLFQGVSSIQ